MKTNVSKLWLGLAAAGFLSLGILSSPSAAAAETPLVAIALAKVKPAKTAEFIEAAIRLVEETRREPGNVSYAFQQSTENPAEFAFYEVYKSEQYADDHMKGKVLGDFFNIVKTFFEPGYPQIKRYKQIE